MSAHCRTCKTIWGNRDDDGYCDGCAPGITTNSTTDALTEIRSLAPSITEVQELRQRVAGLERVAEAARHYAVCPSHANMAALREALDGLEAK